jgi:chromosome segregation ATPase
MTETIRLKEASLLVQTIVALDKYFSDLERIGTKLEENKLKSEGDFEHAAKLLALFAEAGQGVTFEVQRLSEHLNEARARASAVAERVGEKAEVVNNRNSDQNAKFEQFRQLGEKVRDFNLAVSQLRQPEGTEMSPEAKQQVSTRLLEFDSQLEPLIDEAVGILKYANEHKMKVLQQNADSLSQTLQSVRTKIRSLSH